MPNVRQAPKIIQSIMELRWDFCNYLPSPMPPKTHLYRLVRLP